MLLIRGPIGPYGLVEEKNNEKEKRRKKKGRKKLYLLLLAYNKRPNELYGC
jgi:hypothetical protein